MNSTNKENMLLRVMLLQESVWNLEEKTSHILENITLIENKVAKLESAHDAMNETLLAIKINNGGLQK